jgi:ABC-type multidrug transport system ATPase subunit
MADIRTNLGVCPQHNILYDDLSVREHLRIFAKFKGLTGVEAKKAAKTMEDELGLGEKSRSLRWRGIFCTSISLLTEYFPLKYPF